MGGLRNIDQTLDQHRTNKDARADRGTTNPRTDNVGARSKDVDEVTEIGVIRNSICNSGGADGDSRRCVGRTGARGVSASVTGGDNNVNPRRGELDSNKSS